MKSKGFFDFTKEEKNNKTILASEIPYNNYFDNLYHAFHAQRVKAKRSINANGLKIRKITEL